MRILLILPLLISLTASKQVNIRGLEESKVYNISVPFEPHLFLKGISHGNDNPEKENVLKSLLRNLKRIKISEDERAENISNSSENSKDISNMEQKLDAESKKTESLKALKPEVKVKEEDFDSKKDLTSIKREKSVPLHRLPASTSLLLLGGPLIPQSLQPPSLPLLYHFQHPYHLHRYQYNKP